MPDLEISGLPQLAGSDLQGTDPIAIADLSASETKRLTVSDLANFGISFITDGTIPGAKILSLAGAKLVADSVTASQIAPNAIGSSELADLSVDTAAIQDGAVTNVKLASGIDGTKILALSVGDAKIVDVDGAKILTGTITATQLGTDSVTATQLADNAVDTAAVVDAAITNVKIGVNIDGAKILAASITSTQLAADSVTSSELANLSVDTAAIQDLAVTDAKIATGISGTKLTDATVSDAKITGLDGAKLTANSVDTAQLAADSVTATELAANSVGSSELADSSVDTAAVQDSAITDAKLATGISGSKLTDATVGNAKITDLDGAKLTAGSVTATQIAADAVGSSELADNSVGTAAVIDSAITDAKLASGIDGGKLTGGTVANGQLGTDSVSTVKIQDGAVSDAKISNFINGAKLSVSTVPSTALGTVTDRGLDQTTGNIGITNTVAPGSLGGLTWDGTGLITAATASIPSADLPLATATVVGAISTPAAGGLSVDSSGAASIANSITADTKRGIEYDEHGSILSVTDVVPVAGIPLATNSTIGGVKAPGPEVTVDVNGALALGNSGVTAGTYPKVQVNAKGVVTAGVSLEASDIPDLDAGKITSGTFGAGFLAANSVTASQLADYGIAKISSSQPTPEFAGQLWVNPTDRTAYVWVGQVEPAEGYYLPLNNEFGAQANLRFGGTYNANTNTIASLNNYGAEAGLTVGSALIAPTAASSGVYLLVTTAGTGTSPAPAVALDVGDWILSPGSGTTWTHVNLVGAGISVIDATSVTYDGTGLTPPFSGVSDAGAAIDALWGRTQIATLAVKGIVLESTEVTVDNTTGAMAVGVVDEGAY